MQDIVQQSIIASGSLTLFFMLLLALPTILCVVLFFKIWIMTNDVAKIKDMMQEQLDLDHPYVEDDKDKELTKDT